MLLSAQAATRTWDGSAANGLWVTATNWSGDAMPGSGDTANFDTDLNAAAYYTLTLGADRTVRNITFGSGTLTQGFTFNGNILTIANAAGIVNNDDDTQTFNSTVRLSVSQTWNAAAGNLAFAAVLLTNNATNRTLTVTGSNDTIISGTMAHGGSGAGSLIKSGTGELTLTGSNTYTGSTTLSAGILNLGSATATGTGTLILNGGTLDNTSGGALTLANNNVVTIGGTMTFAGTNDLNLGTGNVSLGAANRTFVIDDGTLTVGGVISETSGTRRLTKTGDGTLILSGANTYTGGTTISGGTIEVSALANGGVASGIGDSTNAANRLILLGGTLRYTGGAQSTNRRFTLGTGASAGTFDASGSGAIDFTNTAAMAFSGAGSRTLTLTGTNTGPNTLAAVIGDSGGNTSITKSGAGTWVLSGTNTHNGITTISGGVLSVSNLQDGGVASNIGASTSAAGNLLIDGGTLRYTGADQSTNRLFTLGTGASAGTIDASGSGALNFTNTGSLGLAGSGARTLTLTGSNTGLNWLSAAIGDNGGSTSIAKTGSGIWVLSGNSSYTGTTTVSAGTLAATDSANALGTGSANLSLAGGSLYLANNIGLDFGRDTVVTTNSTIATGRVATGAGVTHSLGALSIGGQTLNVTAYNVTSGTAGLTFGATTLTAGGTTFAPGAGTQLTLGSVTGANTPFTVNGAGNMVITGALNTGTGSLTKAGSGTLTFTGSTGAVGEVHLDAGSISVGSGSTLNTGRIDSAASTTLLIGSGGTVVANYDAGTTTFSGAIDATGGGTFQKNGAGVLVFDQSFNAGAGSTLVLNGGTLSLLGAQITFGTIHITGNTILDFNDSAGTFLSSAALIIDAGVSITVNGWMSIANDVMNSTVWYATSTLNGGGLGPTNQQGGTPLDQIAFTNAGNLTPTWVSGNQSGWFDHEIRPTPEPATYGALLLSACFGLLGWRRFRRRKS